MATDFASMGLQQCSSCKGLFDIRQTKCPHCGYGEEPATKKCDTEGCEAVIPTEEALCPKCKAKAAEDAVEKPTCPWCGKEYTTEYPVCPSCYRNGRRVCPTCGGMFFSDKFRECPACHRGKNGEATAEKNARMASGTIRGLLAEIEEMAKELSLYPEEKGTVARGTAMAERLLQNAQEMAAPGECTTLWTAVGILNRVQVMVHRAAVDEAVSELLISIACAQEMGVSTESAEGIAKRAEAFVVESRNSGDYATVLTLKEILATVTETEQNLEIPSYHSKETENEVAPASDEKESESPTPEEVEDKETVKAAEEAIETAAGEPDGGRKERRRTRSRGKQKDPSPEETNEEAFEMDRAQRSAGKDALIEKARTIWNGGNPDQGELDRFLKEGKHCQDAMAKMLESDRATGLCPSLRELTIA